MVSLYRLLTFRGGPSGTAGGNEDVDEKGSKGGDEIRRYRFHRKIERNRSLAAQAKKLLGATCQVCKFDFGSVYGALGDGYIEAHHLTPLAELPADTRVQLNPGTDFAVLCANRHRMVHAGGKCAALEDVRGAVLAQPIGEALMRLLKAPG
jgi:5-methylcytosine-specific restriction protein A